METPSSNRMITRSQALSTASISKDSEVKSRQRKSGQPLIDITNDSPIVGLTSGSLKTPLTSARKGRSTSNKVTMTPGSGEALLRGQVKNLLQMVEEESELQKLPCRPFVGIYRALTDSPVTLLAPANTPQVPSSADQLGFELPSPIVQDPIFISQAVNAAFDDRKEESLEAKIPLTRSLMLDFSEKDDSDVYECHSTLTNIEEAGDSGSNSKGKSVLGDDDDDSSIWSMQVNASTKDEDEDDEVVYKDEGDELCYGMSGLSLGLPVFTGKHIRFVYKSDDEEEVMEVVE
ncbi:hypothetical protein QQ045_020382 [Rhodiola kirilowii]